MTAHAAKAISLAVAAGGGRSTIFLGDVEGDAEIRAHHLTSETWAYWLLDVTATVDHRAVVIEANGSNGATDSIGGSVHRVRHIVDALHARGGARPGAVVLLGYQDGFHHVPEFFARAAQLADALEVDGHRAALLGPAEVPSADVYNVVVGDLPTLASELDVDGGALRFKGRTITFATNPNLVPALARAGHHDVDLGVFHEGQHARTVHDKGLQQDLCEGTPFTPLRHGAASTAEDAVRLVRELHDLGLAAVVKPNATSGGVGIRVVPVGDDPVLAVAAVVEETVARYGDGAATTALPLRIFEFVTAHPLPHVDGAHLWDLRIEVLGRPGLLAARPVMVRLCPGTFTGALTHDAVVSNLTGRTPSTNLILGPAVLDHRLRPGIVQDLCDAAVAWAARADMHLAAQVW